MKIKTETEFSTFNDGICNIYTKDYEDNRIVPNKYTSLGFGNKILGFKRYFEAAANQIEINRVIRIPNVPGITNYDFAEIDEGQGVITYGVKMVQIIYETNPLSIDLTLDKART